MAFGNPFTRWVYNHSPAIVRNTIASTYSRLRAERKFGPKFDENLADLQRIQWYGSEELQALQAERLRRIIWQSGQHVPYYRELFQSLGLTPAEIRDRSDLVRLPILEKSTVQANNAKFRSSLYLDSSMAEVIHTSGTSGKALQIAVGMDYLKLEKAYLWLQRSWCGVKVGDPTAYFTGHPIVPIGRQRPPFWVEDKTEHREFYSLQHMSKENLPAYADRLTKFAPMLVVGYPTAIFLMASYMCDANITGVRPRGIFTASETLLPHQRKVIEQAFGCKVMDLYGQSEYCGMILQCDHGNYHIQEDYGVMEILTRNGTPAKPGEVGEIICTGLNNLAMPFIRYRTDDTAVTKAGKCPCSRGGALIERITGRVEDIVVTPDGRFLSRLDFVFKEMANVVEAQIIQEERDLIRLRVVAGKAFGDADKARITANFRERAGSEMRIQFDMVDSIPRLSNGKFRYVISKVPLKLNGMTQTGELVGLAAEEEKTL